MTYNPTSTDTFGAATWNVFHGTPRTTLEPKLRQVLDLGVSIILIQEAARPEHRQMLKDNGLRFFWHPRQYVVAWLPSLWTSVAEQGVRLSPTPYYAQGGDGKQYSEAASAILCDARGRSLDVLSYHTPAHIQVAHVEQDVPNRIKAVKESFATLTARAKASQARDCLFGGDDNVDERRGSYDWSFMLRKPLTQVIAPEATHGGDSAAARAKGRRIDDFRITRRLKPADKGRVIPVPGLDDHHIHVHGFTWV